MSHEPTLDDSLEVARMAGSLAHEIKNPLSVIRMNMDLLAEDFAEAQSPRERRALAKVRLVQEQCHRLEHLLDDFLKFARPHNLELRPRNLNQEVDRVLDFLAPQMREANVEVVRNYDQSLPSVMLDSERFHTALLNVVLNAQQSMPEGGQLWVRTRETAGGVALDLIDTGCGMDDAMLLRIFEPFYTTKPGGSGLGLPWTRRIVEAHHGTILVQSELGRGTQFTIELPAPPRLKVDRQSKGGGA